MSHSHSSPAAPDHGEVVHLPCGPKGGDPLVRTYLDACRGTCAFTVLSWPWIIAGIIFTIAGGAGGNLLGGEPEPLTGYYIDAAIWLHQYFGNTYEVFWGMIAGGLVAALLARIIHRPGVPATHDPLIGMPLVVIAYLTFNDPLIGLAIATGAICIIYLSTMLFRLLALVVSGRATGLRFSRLPEPPGGWPIYTVLVPLYRETAVADKILKHLGDLDYPRDRLDVKFLLEADDPETLAALEGAGIPSWAEVVVVPDDQPKTKPRACNHGLERAKGEYLVIYDAEDRPDPDQLKQAVTAYRHYNQQANRTKPIACLQAHLAYHNHRQNLLTRWFALEYNVWFRRYLPGLMKLGGPIPLGGTSNHFRVDILKDVRGWDPFNVTEDCDLGIRLHIAGYRTAIIDSVTWEEANSRVGNWIRQRSRWLKGYMVTHLVWMRRPVHLLRALGPWGMFCYFSAIFGVAWLSALNLILWVALGVYVTAIGLDMAQGHELMDLLRTHRDNLGVDRWSWPMVILGDREDPTWHAISWSLFIASAVQLVANGLFVLINVVFGTRPGQRGLFLAGFLTPFYWVLIAIGAWKGTWQLLFKPHYWEKTVHGLDEHADKS